MAITVTCLILGLIGFAMAAFIFKLERREPTPVGKYFIGLPLVWGLVQFSLGTFSLIAS